MSDWDGFSSDLPDIKEDWQGEVDNAIRLGVERARFSRSLSEVRRENERRYGEVFSTAAIAKRMGVPVEYVERLERGEEPFLEDLFALAQALGAQLTITARSAVEEEQ